MDDDAVASSSSQDNKESQQRVLQMLRQRLSDALIRVSQIDQIQAASESASAQAAESWNTRPLSLPHDILAGTALSQAISLMSGRVPFWDASYVRTTAQTLRAGGTPGMGPGSGGCFTVDAATMLAASHAIEDRVVTSRLDCELYAGFQRLTLFRPQLSRYANLLDNARYIYLFGIDDIPPGSPIFRHPRLIRFVITPQTGSGLLWFWFLLVHHPRFSTVLLARQASGELFQRQSRTRTYRGFWSFDSAIVEEIMRVLREVGRNLFHGTR